MAPPRRDWLRSLPTLPTGALTVLAPWPAAGPTLAFLQFLPGTTNAAFSGHLLLGILHPANELIASQRRDVLPCVECCGIGDQRLSKVSWEFVHDPTGHSRAVHSATLALTLALIARLVCMLSCLFSASSSKLGRSRCPQGIRLLLGQRCDHFDDVLAPIALMPRVIHQLSYLFHHSTLLGRSGN